MKKILSALTSLALTVVSSSALLTNAYFDTSNPYIGEGLTFDDVVIEAFDEEYTVLWENANSYHIVSPKKFGMLTNMGMDLSFRLKNNSELNENSLNELLSENTPYAVCSKYFSDGSSKDYTYIVHKSNLYSGTDLDFLNEVYPVIVDVLSKCDDVVSINQNNVFFVSYTNTYNYLIQVSKDVDFDYDKYSDYNIYNFEAKSMLNILSPFGQNYYYDDSELMTGPKVGYEDEYYADMYNTYLALKNEYGEENVYLTCEIIESGDLGEEKSVSSNVYTAAITGDVITDGEVSIADAVGIMAYISNPENNQLNEQQIANGDIHEPGNGLNANDALKLQQYLAGITEL